MLVDLINEGTLEGLEAARAHRVTSLVVVGLPGTQVAAVGAGYVQGLGDRRRYPAS